MVEMLMYAAFKSMDWHHMRQVLLVQNVTAATAAAQAAAALGQLAAALAGQAPMEPTAVVAAPVTGAVPTCSFSCFMQNPGTSADFE